MASATALTAPGRIAILLFPASQLDRVHCASCFNSPSIILLFNKSALPHPRPRLPRPITSSALDNTIGAIALYLLTFVVVTSYLRIRSAAIFGSLPLLCYSQPPRFSGTAYSPIPLENASVDWSDGGNSSSNLACSSSRHRLLRLRHARKNPARPPNR